MPSPELLQPTQIITFVPVAGVLQEVFAMTGIAQARIEFGRELFLT
jgi:hypothetical protein